MDYTGIIILNYNNYEDTFNCVESIEKYNTAPIKYFVVDNASPREGVVEALNAFFQSSFSEQYKVVNSNETPPSSSPRMTFIINDNNGGYAQGNNFGLKFALKDNDIKNIMILNNDVLFVEDIIPSLNTDIQQLPYCGIVSPILYKKDLKGIDYNCARTSMTFRQAILLNISMGKPWFGIKKKIDEEQYILKQRPEAINEEYVEIDYPSGSCMMATKSLWKTIDGFDPNTFLYFEEAILHSKTSRIGKQNYLIPSLKCIHLGASSTSKSSSPKQTKLAYNSKRYYMLNYFKTSWLQNILLRITLAFGKFALFVRFDLFGKY